MSGETERACWKAWEQGFRAGAGPIESRPKNPYSYDGAEPTSPPEFPKFYVRMDENLMETMDRFTEQMHAFKLDWDAWSRGLR